MAKNTTIQPAQVREVLGKHLLTDGFDMVLDLEESKGAYLHDSKSGKKYLDFFTFFASPLEAFAWAFSSSLTTFFFTLPIENLSFHSRIRAKSHHSSYDT